MSSDLHDLAKNSPMEHENDHHVEKCNVDTLHHERHQFDPVQQSNTLTELMGSNPKPSEDPDDPLNWSRARKHVFLFVISATAFLADYGSATGAVTLLPQAKYMQCLEESP